jgi:hypothetical protein
MENLLKTTLDNLLENGAIEEACFEYGEQGYTLPENKVGILFANWNKFDKYKNFMEWLEQNYELEWSDEWIIDYNESRAYRTVADSYSWQQQFRVSENGELITPDSDIEDWIESCKFDRNNYKTANSCLPDFMEEELESAGFVLLDEGFENGWYGRSDNPKDIAENIFNASEHNELIFVLDSVGQWAITFKVYGR